MDSKLPKINLTIKEIEELLKDKRLEDLLPKSKKCSCSSYFCNICHDTKKVMVMGGKDQDCPTCGPRY